MAHPRLGDVPGVVIRTGTTLEASRAAVWSLVGDRAGLATWLADAVEDHPGGGLLLTLCPQPGRVWRERLRFVESAAPVGWQAAFERLDDGWSASTRLSCALREVSGAVELAWVHEGFHQLPLSRCLTIWEEYRGRWRMALERLASASAAGRR